MLKLLSLIELVMVFFVIIRCNYRLYLKFLEKTFKESFGHHENHGKGIILDSGGGPMPKNVQKKGFIECLSNFMSDSEGLTTEDLLNELKEQG